MGQNIAITDYKILLKAFFICKYLFETTDCIFSFERLLQFIVDSYIIKQ